MYTLETNNTSPLYILCTLMPQIIPHSRWVVCDMKSPNPILLVKSIVVDFRSECGFSGMNKHGSGTDVASLSQQFFAVSRQENIPFSWKINVQTWVNIKFQNKVHLRGVLNPSFSQKMWWG